MWVLLVPGLVSANEDCKAPRGEANGKSRARRNELQRRCERQEVRICSGKWRVCPLPRGHMKNRLLSCNAGNRPPAGLVRTGEGVWSRMTARKGCEKHTFAKMRESRMRFYLRALSCFRQDVRLIGLLLALIACSIGLALLQAWPLAVITDAVLTKTPANRLADRLFLGLLPDTMMAKVIG